MENKEAKMSLLTVICGFSIPVLLIVAVFALREYKSWNVVAPKDVR